MITNQTRLTAVIEKTEAYSPDFDIQNQLTSPIMADRFDVYSIGCLLYYLIMNKLPTFDVNLLSFVPDRDFS